MNTKQRGHALAVVEGAGILLLSFGLQSHMPAYWMPGAVIAAAPWLYLYHRATGERSLLWLVLPAKCVRCGATEGITRWHRGWHCADVLPCYDRARAQLVGSGRPQP